MNRVPPWFWMSKVLQGAVLGVAFHGAALRGLPKCFKEASKGLSKVSPPVL